MLNIPAPFNAATTNACSFCLYWTCTDINTLFWTSVESLPRCTVKLCCCVHKVQFSIITCLINKSLVINQNFQSDINKITYYLLTFIHNSINLRPLLTKLENNWILETRLIYFSISPPLKVNMYTHFLSPFTCKHMTYLHILSETFNYFYNHRHAIPNSVKKHHRKQVEPSLQNALIFTS